MKTNLACAALSMMLLAANVCHAAGRWGFPVGLSYMSGIWNVLDYYEELYPELDTSWAVPVGLSFTPYYEFEHGSRITFDLGPAAVILIEEDRYYKGSWESVDETYWDVPIGLTYGYTFLPRASITPYARVGFKYHIAGGDYVDSSTPGPFGAVGVEFMRNKVVGISFEVGYDGSEVTMEGAGWGGRGYRKEDVKSGEVLVSLRAVF